MIIECDQCSARYTYEDARFDGKVSKKVRCTRCLTIFEIFNTCAFESQPSALTPHTPDETVSRLDQKSSAASTRKNRLPAGSPSVPELRLPDRARLSLAVIAGPDAGKICPIEKARTVIGRSDADINLDDPEISRQHAALEVTGDRVMLIDLGSTNGTFVGPGSVEEALLANQGEFTIGSSTLMLIVTATGVPGNGRR